VKYLKIDGVSKDNLVMTINLSAKYLNLESVLNYSKKSGIKRFSLSAL
jgi:hypothetical protein